MLILKRKQNEEIRIGNDIVITLLAVGNRTATIGIHAPKHVQIVRTEIDHHEPKPLKAMAAAQDDTLLANRFSQSENIAVRETAQS